MKSVVFSTASAILVTSSQAWSINGHLYVAAIAERLLEENSPDSLQSSYDLLQKMTDVYPEKTWRERDHALVECSTFADDWKYRGEAWQGYYHYININWFEQGDESDYDVSTKKTKDIVDGCNQIIAWLSGQEGEDYKEANIYTYLMAKYDDDEDVAKSYAFRMLVHLIGDLVQPLHSMSRYNEDYPRGDKGGLAFKLPYRYTVKHLHSLWDKVHYQERKNIRRPIEPAVWDDFELNMEEMMETYDARVLDPLNWQSTDIEGWSEEAWELAKTVYDGITENEAVPQAYLDKNTPIAYEQLVLGGYRLYYVIDYIFSGQTNE